MLKLALVLLVVLLSGCSAAASSSEIAAGTKACESRGGVRFQIFSMFEEEMFEVVCNDSARIIGYVKKELGAND